MWNGFFLTLDDPLPNLAAIQRIGRSSEWFQTLKNSLSDKEESKYINPKNIEDIFETLETPSIYAYSCQTLI